MFNFYTLLTLIFVILIVANLYRMLVRRPIDNHWEDEYTYKRRQGRDATPSNSKWQADEYSGTARYEAAEQKIIELKQMITEKGTAAAPTGISFADVPIEERKIKVMSTLNPMRGQSVVIHTQQGKVYSGTITSLTGQQVMIRDKYEGKVVGVQLEDVIKVI